MSTKHGKEPIIEAVLCAVFGNLLRRAKLNAELVSCGGGTDFGAQSY
jgi:hypothetical protein